MVGSKERVCWISDRHFAGDRALRGHQKSHYSHLPLPPKTNPTRQPGTKNSIGRRSKRHHAEPGNKVLRVAESDHMVLSDMEAASFLIKLSRGNGLVKKLSHGIFRIVNVAPTTEVVDMSSESSVIDDDGDSDDDDYEFMKTFKCPYCEKMFGSEQGLGGHKRIHNRKATEPETIDSSAGVNNSKTYTIDLNLLPDSENNKD